MSKTDSGCPAGPSSPSESLATLHLAGATGTWKPSGLPWTSNLWTRAPEALRGGPTQMSLILR